MKKFNLSLIIGIVVFLNFSTFAQTQTGKLISRVTDLTIFGQASNSGVLSGYFNEFGTIAYKKAFPNSRRSELQSVYEFSCACNGDEFLAAMANFESVFQFPEIYPTFETLSLPNDYGLVYSLDYALDLIGAERAWDVSTGSSSVVIAITDSNYDLNHEELYEKYSHVQTGISHPNTDHGTAVAITAAGNTHNGVGKSSIGYNSDLKLYGMGYNELLIASYDGAHVINASWAAGCSYSQYFQDVINEVRDNGSIIVAAAGNGGTCGAAANYVFPAAFDGVISVSSIGPDYNHEGVIGDTNSTHQHNDKVTLCAPGYNIALSISNNVYTYGNGTSFAAPIVSGTIALMLEANPCLSYETILEILSQSSTPLDLLNPNYAGKLGFGALNAGMAVTMAKKYEGPKVIGEITKSCEATNHAISLQVSGGVAPYSVEWNSGHNDLNISGLNNGTYTVVVEDANGCSSTTSFTIEVLPIEVNATINHVSEYGMEDGEITLVESAQSTLSYLWSTGQNSNQISNLSAGYYSVIITNNDGCSITNEYQIQQPDQTTTANISENQQNTNVNVYPNPTKNVAKITWKEIHVKELYIINATGAIVLTENVELLDSFEINGLAVGMYLINLVSFEGYTTSTRLLVN